MRRILRSEPDYDGEDPDNDDEMVDDEEEILRDSSTTLVPMLKSSSLVHFE
jgi:hypothetical protein